ncbi:MAG: DUF72 domain-containing protein, partial [Verrucomicrobiota bacterium]
MSCRGGMGKPGENISVGTASWSDPGFVEYWYPPKLAAGDRLGWYAQFFRAVEVNSSFYAVPDAIMAKRWCESTPDGFTFDVKLHQVLSRHSAKAKLLPPGLRRRLGLDPEDSATLNPELEEEVMEAFRPALEVLKRAGKLGTLLLQLSPAFSPQQHKIEELDRLFELTSDYSLAVEFRNRHWTEPSRLEEIISYLRSRRGVFVNVDTPSADHFTIMPATLNAVTNPELAYLRLHGRDAKAYLTGKTVARRFNYDYSPAEISEVAER